MRLINLDNILKKFPKADFDGDDLENMKAYPHWKTDITGLFNILKSVPTIETCEDCISRKRLIILVDEGAELHPYKVAGDSETYSNYNQGWTDAFDWLYANIDSDNLPSVTPQLKNGKWIDVESLDGALWHACSECGETEYYATDYCPNCGAKMREVEE